MEDSHSLACREVFIVSVVSILNDSEFRKVFKVLRSKIGLHQLLGLAGCKTPGIFDLLPVLLHICY